MHGRSASLIQIAWKRWKRAREVKRLAIRQSAVRIIWRRWLHYRLVKTAKNFLLEKLSNNMNSVFTIQILNAQNLSNGNGKLPDPFVCIHGERKGTSGRPPSRRRSSSLSSKEKGGHADSLFCYESKSISMSLNPNWNEKAVVAGVSCNERIIFTVLDSGLFSKKDSSLGQVNTPLQYHCFSLFFK